MNEPQQLTSSWVVEDVRFDVTALWNITVVRGRFARAGGVYEAGPNGSLIELTVDLRSLDTGDPEQDERLLSLAGADLAAHPQARFRSASIRRATDGKLRVAGTLDAAGSVVPVEFAATAREEGGRLRLAGKWKVDERWLGGRDLPLAATVHVEIVFAPEAA